MKSASAAFLLPAIVLVAVFSVLQGCATKDALSGASTVDEASWSITDALEPAGNPGRTLVVFYSKGNTTSRVAGDMAILYGADIEEITETKSRSGGFFAFMTAGYQATFGVVPEISAPSKDPSAYDRVVVCTPIWAWSLCPPVRAYLRLQKGKFPSRTGFITVSGDTRPDKVAAAMSKESGATPLSIAGFGEKDFSAEARTVYAEKLASFMETLK